jgi:tripartite-type tricarboxylate transporter receptor subunit TctC
MVDATTAAAGGHVDAAIGLYPDLQGLIDAKKLTVLGYTGSKEISGFENLLLSRNGVPEASGVTSNHAMFVSTAMNPERFQDLRHLLVWANQAPQALQGYAKDQMIPTELNLIQTRRWYEAQRKYWQQKINKINSKTEIK